jgi:YVTN family beta-propeller protein
MKLTVLKHALLGMAALTAPALAAPGMVYVADEGSDTVSVLDGASFKKVAAIPVGRQPHNVQVSPDGKLVWVTNGGSASDHGGHGNAAQGEIWAIDTATREVAARIPVGKHPAHVVLTPDGRFAYVTNGGEDTVSVVDTQARKAVGAIPVGAYPHGIRISPDGGQAYVANLKGATVSVIDTATRKEVARIPVGKGPAQTGFSPDGRLAFVSLSQENKVALIDPVARRVVARIAVGSVPIQLYATPDSRKLFVANQGTKQRPGNTVSVIDLAAGRVAGTVQTGAGAHGVIVDRGGRYAYVTNTYANSVTVIDAGSAKVLATVPVGNAPNGISLAP